MAFVFDATVKGATSTSYVSVTEADNFFGGHLHKDMWEDKTTLDKQILLATATHRLEMEQWSGKKTTQTQRLQWPRSYVESRDANYISNINESLVIIDGDIEGVTYYIDSEIIPNELKWGLFELVDWYMVRAEQDPHLIDEYNQEILTQFEIGPLKGSIKNGLSYDRLPSNVKRFLNALSPSGWLGGGQTKLVRG